MAFVFDPNQDYKIYVIQQLLTDGFSGSDTLATVLTTVKAAVDALGIGGLCPLCGGSGQVTKDKITGNPTDSSITVQCPPSSATAAVSGCHGWGKVAVRQTITSTILGGTDITV